MKYTLGELVYETSKGRADTLSKICTKDATIRMLVIESLWSILILLPDDAFMNSPELPEQLVFSHQRFHFTNLHQITYSKSALKKRLFQILRRLFEVSTVLELLEHSWFSTPQNNILSVIRELCGDLSVVMYMFNSIDFRAYSSKTDPRDLPKHIYDVIQSVCVDFTCRYEVDHVEKDLSTANIACNYVQRYHGLVENEVVKAFMIEFLVVNVVHRPDPEWPFIKTLHTMTTKKITVGRRLQLYLPRMATALFSRLASENYDDHKSQEQLGVLLWAIKQIQKAKVDEWKVDMDIFSRIPTDMKDFESKAILSSIIFHLHAKTGILEAAPLRWLERATGEHFSGPAHTTNLFMAALLHHRNLACPTDFVANMMRHRIDYIDWICVVKSPHFIYLMETKIMLSACSPTLLESVCGLFEQPVLLEACVKAGLLRKLRDNVPDNLPALVVHILVSALVHEVDDQIVASFLRASLSHLTKYIETVPLVKAKCVMKRVGPLLSVDDALRMLNGFACDSKYLERHQYFLECISESVGTKIVQTRCKELCLQKNVDFSRISWLQPLASDTPAVTLLKQAVTSPSQFSMADFVSFVLSTSDFGAILGIYKHAALGDRLRFDQLHGEYDQRIFPTSSPVFEYMVSLHDSESIQETVKLGKSLITMNDFLLSRIVWEGCLQEPFDAKELFQLPVGLLWQEPIILSTILTRLCTIPDTADGVPVPEWFIRTVSDICECLFPAGGI